MSAASSERARRPSPAGDGPRASRRVTVDLVLNGLRDPSGRPNLRVRVLAVVLALLLAGPLTVLVVRLLSGVVDALY